MKKKLQFLLKWQRKMSSTFYSRKKKIHFPSGHRSPPPPERTFDRPRPPRRCECHPGTNFWHPPVEVTQFGTRGSVLAPKKIILIKRRGKSKKQKLLEMVQVLFHTDEFIFVWSFKNGNGRQNHSSGAKTWLHRRTGQNLVPVWHSQRRGPAWSIISARNVSFLNFDSYTAAGYSGLYTNTHNILNVA